MEIVNTQNKVYNHIRRTYIDEKDCKEGELICKKCSGAGQIDVKNYHHTYIETCSQCMGRGIVDWITQAVERPPLSRSSSTSSSSMSSSCSYRKPKISYNPVKSIPMPGNVHIKQGTNYKRRAVV